MDKAILEDFFFFVGMIVGMGCLTGVLVTYFKSRGGKQARSPELAGRLNEISERLGALDHAIDTMAIEVERISEGQRFVARVLAERNTAPSLPEKPRSSGSTTPH